MRNNIITLLLISVVISVHAQSFTCEMPEPTNSDVQMQVQSASSCNNKLNYTVYPDLILTPIKTLRISFEVFQKADGTGSFNGTDEEITQMFSTLIDIANQHLSNLQLHVPIASSNYVSDTRIRFKLNKVYFYKNDDLYYYTTRQIYNPTNGTYSAPDRNNADSIYNNIILTRSDLSDIDKNHTLHLIMEPKGTIGKFGGQAQGFGSHKWVVMRAYDYYWNKDLAETGTYMNELNVSVHHFIHEVGHAMGLYHIFDCYDCNDYGCPAMYSTNNYMDYGYWPNLQSLTEQQISKIHYSLMGYFGTISQDYINDYCYFDNTQSITINSGQDITWPNARNLQGNIDIYGKLLVNCKISIPKDGKILINNGGQLNLDQGIFDNQCDEDWGGIVVKSGGLLILNASMISDYNIKVESGGTIIIKGSLSIVGNHNITIQSGGFICVETGTSIQLSDYNSLIKINEGALNGVNPLLSVTSNCMSNPNSVTVTGSGSIADFNQDIYIQNQTISTNRYVGGKNIYVGNHVDTNQTAGNVLINNGANVIFDGKNVTFDKGFECASGSTYETRNH